MRARSNHGPGAVAMHLQFYKRRLPYNRAVTGSQRQLWRHGRWLAIIAIVCLGGCVAFVTRQIEQPPRVTGAAQVPRFLQFAHEQFVTARSLRIDYWYGLARAYAISASVTEKRTRHGSLSFNWSASNGGSLRHTHGSVMLLHAWGMNGASMVYWGASFANAGYVVVMPDLRDQGRSGDAPIGYGPREASDIVDLVAHLRSLGRLPKPLYLFGISYGATVALFAAPQLPEVGGVIALEPYANAAAVIHHAVGNPLFGHTWLAALISRREVDQAIARASHQLGVNLAHVTVRDALIRARACTLVLHGDADHLTSAAALRDAARGLPHVHFVAVRGENHLSLAVRTDRLLQPLLGWMQAIAPAHPPWHASLPAWLRLLSPASFGGLCPTIAPLPAA